jgi:guanine deaminase
MVKNMEQVTAYRSSILHFLKSPEEDLKNCYEYFADGLLVIENGKVKTLGNTSDIQKTLPPNTEIIDYTGFLLTPGFIDLHIHYVQTEIIASYGEQLLEWLNNYVFPTERKFSDKNHAKTTAFFFLKELLRNGTTTAAVYSSVHEVSADTLFSCADKLNMRILTGKTLMDRNAPDYLVDTPQKAYDESKRLIQKWHNKNRLSYIVTPRFAPTSTEEQLKVASTLMKEFKDVYLQSHISENINEVKWVKELYPWSKNYTDVYDHFELLGERSIFGHGIYLSDEEFQRFHDTKSVIAWCPTSNFFLGSGVFNLGKAKTFHNRVGIGTDVGGGSSFSMLQTLSAAYKAAAIQNLKLSPLESFYYITLGNAKALSLDNKIGNFTVGKEADFVVLDLNCTPLIASKMAQAKNLEDKLFNLSVLGDDRAIHATYILGVRSSC